MVLVLWPSLMQLPRPASIEIYDAPPMAFDYAVRHGLSLGTEISSFTGPLGALLTGVHSGQLLWLNYWCQSLAGLTFALSLSWILLHTPGAARIWLGSGLLAIAGFRPEYLHLALLLISGILLIGRSVSWQAATGIGFNLGLLALINVNYAILALAVVALNAATGQEKSARAWCWAGTTLVTVVLLGWAWSGQPIGDLPAWFWHGLISTPLRHQAAAALWTGPALAWGAVSWILVLALLAGTISAAVQRWQALALAGFFFAVIFYAWRQATGQPEVMPQTFFTVALMAGLLWLTLRPAGLDRGWIRWLAATTMVTTSLGLLSVEPRLLTEPVILLNRKIAANLTALSNRRSWQSSIKQSFQSAAQLFALPQIRAATAGQPTDLLGNATGYALLNGLNFAPRPGVQSYLVGGSTLAERDAAYYSGASAPAFVIQRLHAFDNGLAALEDAPAQRALYAHYDFQFEENGFVLWQQRSSSALPARPGLSVWHTMAAWGQPVSLPVKPGRSYWVSIETTRSTVGWVKNELLPPDDPFLLLRDEDGSLLSYRTSPAALAGGFLLNPLFRGEIDLVRYQAGEPPPVIREITLQPAAGHAGDFTGEIEISLWDAATPPVSGRKESAANLARKFRIANRLPVAIAAYYSPQTVTPEHEEVLMVHPDSCLEFPVRPGDTRVSGRFGLLAGSYQNGNATDGVEFVIEYLPANGRTTVLWRRQLDPLLETADRGMQEFSLALPQPASGRVILRTQNLPGHNAAWDWSFWTDLRFEPSPAKN